MAKKRTININYLKILNNDINLKRSLNAKYRKNPAYYMFLTYKRYY